MLASYPDEKLRILHDYLNPFCSISQDTYNHQPILRIFAKSSYSDIPVSILVLTLICCHQVINRSFNNYAHFLRPATARRLVQLQTGLVPIVLAHLNMPELLDFPNELLREIANQACHVDTVNLALSCRLLLALSDKALRRHNDNRDAYFPISFGDVQHSSYAQQHPLCMIRDIMQDVEAACYPMKIIISDFTALDDPLNITGNANNGELDQIVASYRSQMRTLVNANRYINRRHMWASILGKEQGLATAFLLTLLPELRIIELHDLSMSGATVLSTVRRIVNETRRHPNRSHPLSKLEIVCLQGLVNDFDTWANLEVFVGLHSLRTIHCQYVRGNINPFREEATPWIHHPERLSDVSTLDFSKCALEHSDLVPAFKSIKALQTFSYEYARPERLRNRHMRAGKWEPRQIVQSLLTRFSDSLVVLEMTTANPEVRHGSFNAGQIFVGDLRNFRVLKKLNADTLLFIESSLEEYIVKAIKEEFETARQKRLRNGNHHFALSAKEHTELVDRYTDYATNIDDRVHRLESLLPVSLEDLTLCLTLARDSHVIEPLFEGLPGSLDKLNKMTFEGGDPLKDAKKAVLARAGVLVL